MKTPDEIKTGLETCASGAEFGCIDRFCPYGYLEDDGECCDSALCDDALAYIRQLEAELEAVKRERDALLEAIDHACETCKNYEACTGDGCCMYCDNNESDATPCCKCIYSCNWEWRGLYAENGGKE